MVAPEGNIGLCTVSVLSVERKFSEVSIVGIARSVLVSAVVWYSVIAGTLYSIGLSFVHVRLCPGSPSELFL
jgi:hypothetical protein